MLNKLYSRAIYRLGRETVLGFIHDGILSHGAAIAFFTVTSMAPLLLVVTAVAGLAFGSIATKKAIVDQLAGLTGSDSAGFFQSVLENASSKSSGAIASLVGLITLLITVSGVFGEMQSALNAIWKVKAQPTTVSRLVRARATSFGLVVALGFLLMTSLSVSAALATLGQYLQRNWPELGFVLVVLNFLLSIIFIAAMFAAIFKVLPDRKLEWRDVFIGAVASSVLFSFGKYLIAIYLGTSGIGTVYGAAGTLILLLFWVYYSVQILLLGAEFTKAYAQVYGSRKTDPALRTKVVKI